MRDWYKIRDMENTNLNFKSPRVLLGLFLGAVAWIVISLVFRPSFITMFFCIWLAANTAKITEPKLVSQIGGGLGALAGIHFALIGELNLDDSFVGWGILVEMFVGAAIMGAFFAVVGYFGAKLLRKYEQGQGPFF